MSRALGMAVVVATAGVTLVLEILAMRLVAPYVGLTLDTYSAAIGIALLGIAGGAWLGGKLADEVDPRITLGPTLVAAGALVFLTRPIVLWLGPHMAGQGPKGAVALVGAATAPAILALSMAHPAVVKLRLADLSRTGTTVGGLSAAGTLGALGGTFLTGFILLGSLSTRTIVLGAGTIVVVLGVIVMLVLRAQPASVASLLVLPIVAVVAAPHGGCDRETKYFCVVTEGPPSSRLLQMDDLIHAEVDVQDPRNLLLEYSRRVADVIAAARPGSEPLEVLHVGGGGFAMPRYLAAVRPGTRSRVLELDPGVVEVARQELGLRTGADLQVRVGDARVGITDEPSGHYDVVFGDAFASRSVPWHLTTREFASQIRRVLLPDGVYVENLIDAGEIRFVRAQVATLRTVFDNVVLLSFATQTKGNFIVAASQAPLPLERLRELAADGGGGYLVTPAEAMPDGAQVLSDDFAPVDQLLSNYAASAG